MAVLRLTSTKTLPLLLAALKRIRFTQTELSRETSISIGRVNKVITFLKDKGIVIKEGSRYVITQPNKLADLIAAQQAITKTRTYYVATNKEEMEEAMRQEAIKPCMNASLEGTEPITITDTEEAQAFLNKLPRGERQVELYRYGTRPSDDQVRAIIDLKTINKGYEAERLAMQTWGTRQ